MPHASILLLTGTILVVGCGGDGGTSPGDGGTSPGMGSLQLATTTTGSPLDPDGYLVSLDGGEPQAIGLNATLVVDPIAAGTHTVLLSDLIPECEVTGENPRTVSVVAGLLTH